MSKTSVEQVERQLEARETNCAGHTLEVIDRYGWSWLRCINCGSVHKL